MSGNEQKTKPTASGGARAIRGSNAAISVIVAGAILVMLNFLAMRHYARADWTSSGMYTLSDKTAKTVGALGKDVEMHVLWSQGDPRYADVKEVIDGYAALSARVKVEVVDPDVSPERVRMIIDKYGAKVQVTELGQMGIEAGVFVVSGGNVKFVASNELEDMGGEMFDEGGGGDEGLSEFKAEQQLTSAILRVISEEQATVCFTQGHGEWEFEGFGPRALRHLKDALRQDSYKVEAITTAGATKVPGTCGLVVVAGPARAFMDEEAALLDRHLESGGRLLLLLDPIVEGEALLPTGLEGLAAKRGIRLDNDFMLETDPRRLVSESPVTFLVSEFTAHDAVKALAVPESAGREIREQLGAYPVVVSAARSLSAVDGGEIVADVLARSSADSWGETDVASLGIGDRVPEKGQADVSGPATLAMAVALAAKGEGEGGRLVVIGDSDFLNEELYLSASLYNRDLWSGAVGWLTAREDLISIAPKNPERVRLALTEDDVGTIWMIVIGEIALMLILGVAMWLVRRR
ncbi:MAG: GldG family protein [Proteobacteria bacterium]|jgi:hypothetical protein|nr:GldG family protein [Pseudomonadota bacterium]